MKPAKKVGILGGTFNPVHCGHLHLAKCAVHAAALDEVLFIPSGISYMKDQTEILSAERRLEMVHLAVRDCKDYRVSEIEIQKSGNSYSYETILALKEQDPSVKYFFLIGADTLFMIEHWKNPEIIFRETTLLAAYRIGTSLETVQRQIRYLCEKYDADIQLAAVGHMDISSSDIRQLVKAGSSIQGLVPESVEQYIRQHHLYTT